MKNRKIKFVGLIVFGLWFIFILFGSTITFAFESEWKDDYDLKKYDCPPPNQIFPEWVCEFDPDSVCNEDFEMECPN